MKKNDLSPQESLDIIQKAITRYKMNYRESSTTFLLWGWILTLASISNFIILRILNNMEAHQLKGLLSLANWALFSLIGFVFLYFSQRNIDKNKKVYSSLDGYIKTIWIVAGSAFFVGTLICIRLGIAPPPVMLLIAGIATTTSGLFIKYKPVIFGGIAFFVFSVAATFVSNEYVALIVGAAIIFGYLVPGYLLKSVKE